MTRASAALLAVALTVACESPPPAPSCRGVSAKREAASLPDRKLLGLASSYPADARLSARREELVRSQRARRGAAWHVVERVLAPVALADPTPLEGARVPRFRTWYDRDDVRRVFQRVYEAMGPEGRAARARVEPAALDEAFAWSAVAVGELDTWPDSRWEDYVGALDDEAAVGGIGGVRRLAMSPDAARHVIESYPEVLRCLADGAPPAFIDAPAERDQRLSREPIALSRCGDRHAAGPFFVARGGTLRAAVMGEGASTATLRVVEGPASAAIHCEASAREGCAVEGPGEFFVTVSSGVDALDGALEVHYSAPDVGSPACLDGPFPFASASIAAEWRRVEPGWTLPTYDTSGPALTRRFADDPPSWGEGDGAATPGPDSIYTIQLPSGPRFQLAGLHIRTRELAHWMNITLWFSPEPDQDFGADRPDAVRALGEPWSSYKMCVAIEFDEHDPDPSGGFLEDAPSLAAALRAVHEGQGGPSWCSNPYIDAGPGLARSNCVGCHQHAMSGARPAEVAVDDARFPEGGRLQMRNNFPADHFWGLDAGDDLAAELSTVVEWWDTTE